MERDDVDLKVFNAAKLFAEQVLFPMMETYYKMKRQSDFGSANLDDAKLLNPEIKDIERYNGLKGMNDTVASLLNAISSTVMLKSNKEEISQLKKLKEVSEKIRFLFYDNREKFFSSSYRNGQTAESLNRDYFDDIKKIIDACYINTEILMTRNKLLFADAHDGYMDDDEIKKSIREEYVDG